MNRWLDELKTLLRFPSISTDSTHAGDVRDCAEWLVGKIREFGLEAELRETPRHPVVIGRNARVDGRLNVLLYGHYDVQPVDPLELWDTPPFEPVVADGRIRARGATDNKGQFFAHLCGVAETIAETGGFVVCTIEGNADLGTHLPPVHIACMGLEKIIPRFRDLAPFMRVLARSATGQPITTYTSHFLGPRDGQEMHVVIVDNGRTLQMAKEEFRSSLHCIRCGACINTCPVYRRSGGHSYQFTSPGPIGSVIAPLRDPKTYTTLPFASSLCGSCTDVCPVKINLHEQLLAWRKVLMENGHVGGGKRQAMAFAAYLFRSGKRFERVGRIGRWCMRNFPRFMLYNPMNPWGRQRELPPAPKESFREWYRKNGDDT